jgi:hypothetical protein
MSKKISNVALLTFEGAAFNGYTKISSKAKNVTLKAAPSNVRSATFDIFLDIFSFKCN